MHELGHILMGILWKWKIDQILILPFGALTIFNEDLNRPMWEEFWIVIMGPVFQILFTFFLCFVLKIKEATDYSLTILIFNMLPIYPLDGAKILNLALNKILSFKKSHLVIIIISLIGTSLLIIKYHFNLLWLLIITFLLIKIIKEILQHPSLFNRFLLERYLNNYSFHKINKIKAVNVSKMKRDYKHFFFNGKRYISEREVLKKRFDRYIKL